MLNKAKALADDLSDKAKAALEEFAKALPDENPREDLLARARQ